MLYPEQAKYILRYSLNIAILSLKKTVSRSFLLQLKASNFCSYLDTLNFHEVGEDMWQEKVIGSRIESMGSRVTCLTFLRESRNLQCWNKF